MPVPIWGIIGYGFVLLLILLAGMKVAQKQRFWALLILVTALYSIYSIILAVISHLYIHSYCIMCILSYGISFTLLFYCWLIWRRFDPDRYTVSLRSDFQFLWHHRRMFVLTLAPFLAGVVLVWTFFPAYWNAQPSAISAELKTGLTPEGYPWIGSEDADLIITEFTDYLCFQCSKMHFYLRKLMNQYPGKMKIIHRHFPMDSRFNPIVKIPFHEGSGMLALFAIYAKSENKFWQANDFFYTNARSADEIDLKGVANTLTLNTNGFIRTIRNPEIRRHLRRDIRDGLRIGVTGTPSYLIDGKLYVSNIPPNVLSRVMN
jgi:protein-disulfide isomerase